MPLIRFLPKKVFLCMFEPCCPPEAQEGVNEVHNSQGHCNTNDGRMFTSLLIGLTHMWDKQQLYGK